MADVSKYIEKAEAEVRRRNFDAAVQLYAQILKIDPDSGEARSGIRRAGLKKFEKRYPSPLTRGLGNLPTAILLPIAKALRLNGMVASLAEGALRRDPRNPKLNNALGYALLAQGHRKGARAAFEVAAEFDATNVEALKTLGELHYEAKDLEAALDCYERVLKVAPRDQDAARMRKNLAAEGAIRKGGFEGAKSARELAKSQRQLQEAESAQRIVRTSKDRESALSEIEAKLEENPGDLTLLRRKGELQLEARAFDDAVDTLMDAKRLAPDDEKLLDLLGDARMARLQARENEAKARGDEGEARSARRSLEELRLEEYGRRVAAHPTDLGLRYRYAQALHAEGSIEEAIEQLQRAVKDPQHRNGALHLLGKCFAASGMHDLAIKQLREAAEALGGMGDQRKNVLYDLAQVHEAASAPAEALAIYKEIYEADISFRDVAERIRSLG